MGACSPTDPAVAGGNLISILISFALEPGLSLFCWLTVLETMVDKIFMGSVGVLPIGVPTNEALPNDVVPGTGDWMTVGAIVSPCLGANIRAVIEGGI